MEEKIKKLLLIIDSKVDNFIKELQEKKNILKNILNIEMNKSLNNNSISKNEEEQKFLFKKLEILNQIENIIIKDYSKDDFLKKIKQISDIYELIEDNEEIIINNNKDYINNNINKFPKLRMEQKNILTNFGARALSICSIKENNNIYNKLCVGLNNGKILIYNLNNGNKLLEISDAIKNDEILDICDLKNGIIACTSGFSKISIIKIKEDIIFNENNNSIKLSSEIIQKIEPRNINERFTKNRIINIKLNNISFKNNNEDYENDYIIQSGWNHLNVYIKKKNNRYYFYKEIKTPSRTYSLFSYESKNLFLAQDFFSNGIYIFSSKTMELITIIRGIIGNGININTFGKLNNKIIAFLGLHKIYLYNINNLKLIEEIEIGKNILCKNIIFSGNNSLIVFLFNYDNREYKIIEYKYYQKEKSLIKKRDINSEIFKIKYNQELICYLSNNENGKKYLIITFGDNKVVLLK